MAPKNLKKIWLENLILPNRFLVQLHIENNDISSGRSSLISERGAQRKRKNHAFFAKANFENKQYKIKTKTLNFTDNAAEDNAPEDVMLSENNEDNINHISRLMLSRKWNLSYQRKHCLPSCNNNVINETSDANPKIQKTKMQKIKNKNR